MKQLHRFLVTFLLFTYIPGWAMAQDPREADIKRLETLDRESVL